MAICMENCDNGNFLRRKILSIPDYRHDAMGIFRSLHAGQLYLHQITG